MEGDLLLWVFALLGVLLRVVSIFLSGVTDFLIFLFMLDESVNPYILIL